MRRDLAEPVDAAVLHGGGGIEAFGDGVGDDRETLFLQQLQQPPLLLDQRIDPRRLAIEKAAMAICSARGGTIDSRRSSLILRFSWTPPVDRLSSVESIGPKPVVEKIAVETRDLSKTQHAWFTVCRDP